MNQIWDCAVAVFLGLATPTVANAGLYTVAVADVDHSRKSDWLSVWTISVGSIDISDTSILYGDRSGRLRSTNRVTRPDIVLETNTFPQPTPLETIDAPAREKAFETDAPTPAQPAGCEAAVSLIVDPTLARLVGRCFA